MWNCWTRNQILHTHPEISGCELHHKWFYPKIIEVETVWWRYHDVWSPSLSMHDHTIKSYQDLMRSYQVISVNMRFLLEISEAEMMWWRHHDFWDSWLLMYDQSYEVSSRSIEKWSSYQWKHAMFVRNQWTVKAVITPSWRQGFISFIYDQSN